MLCFLSRRRTGDPLPQLTWWRDNHLLDSSFETTFSRTLQNTLTIPRVSRLDLGAQLICQANNNNISMPVSTKVNLDMKCKYKKHISNSDVT